MAITDMVWRVRAEVKRWEAEVKMRLDWNMRQGHLTPFGEALVPLMERAGIKEPQELLLRAGRHEEPHALEILLRHMYGPPTEPVSGYLLGWDEALGIEDSREEQITLSRTLMARYTSRSEQRCA